MKNKITNSIFLMVPFLLFGQMIDNFDSAPEDSTYWVWETSENAVPDSGYINMSFVTDQVSEGAGAMQLEYSAHNIEAWGGYTKIYHMGSSAGDQEPGSIVAGTWKLSPEEGALKVGPGVNDGSWWQNSLEDVTTRACLFDDQFVFGSDGSFSNVMGTETWVETWQGVATEGCATPVAPHDGSNAATYSYDAGAGTVTLTGVGAHIGLPKVYNGGELNASNADSSIESITYDIALSGADSDTMTVSIHQGGGYWTFKLLAMPPAPQWAGTWKLSPEEGALKVGPGVNDGSWWQNSLEDVTTRACLFDDQFVFGSDGSFSNVMGTETWVETWQGVATEGCATPVAPHDGSNAATYSYDAGAGTVTLTGVGAHIGLPKVYNGGELNASNADSSIESITYDIALSGADSDTMTVSIHQGGGYWTFKLVADDSELALAESWDQIFDWDATFDNGTALFSMLPDEGEVWDWSSYDSISFSYYNSIPQSLADRINLRLNLSDYGSIADPASYTGLGEYYYSFHYILDNDPGWNTITMPLVRNDDWGSPGSGGGGFNLTGWAGEAGNGELDTDAIAGFHFEFSISGGGDGDRSHGTIILDNFTLSGSKDVLGNPGFELADEQDDGFGWGAAIGGGHAEVITDASMAHNGDNYLSIGTTDNWAVYYTEDSIPAQYGETWRFSGYGKDLGGDGSGAAFKLEAKDAGGNIVGTTNDVALAMTNDWENHSIELIAPEGTVTVTAVVVASRWDGVACDFAFDDMFLMNIGILDVVPPAAVENVSATGYSFYNLVTWSDNDGEEGETYNVYASRSEITDVTAAGVDVIATSVLEGAQAAVHYIYAPLEDEAQDWYYAVSCSDASLNVGEAGIAASPITNTAKGIPTISLSPPSFTADGDLSEWYDSGIEPFVLATTENSWGTPHIIGAVNDDNDLSGEIWLAVDENYLYVATEVIDDVYDGYQAGDGTGGWWENDVFELFIGFYEQPGTKHVGMMRGDEPDYKFYFLETHAVNDFNGQDTLAVNGTDNYHHESFGDSWMLEARLSLDDIAFGDDIRLNAVDGMRIPIEPTFHDNDGTGWEGNLVSSLTNNDNAYQTPSVWSSTWIGESSVGIDDEIIPLTYALHPNYPNPFNPVTHIQFTIPEQTVVKLQIFDVLGRQVDVLVNETLPIGHHEILWNPKNLSSGFYFYKLEAGSFMQTRKMILLK